MRIADLLSPRMAECVALSHCSGDGSDKHDDMNLGRKKKLVERQRRDDYFGHFGRLREKKGSLRCGYRCLGFTDHAALVLFKRHEDAIVLMAISDRRLLD